MRMTGDEQLLLNIFGSERAIAVRDAADLWLRTPDTHASALGRPFPMTGVDALVRCGLLVPEGGMRSPYTAEMASAYPKSRPVPKEICSTIITEGHIQGSTEVLDIGTGPGDVALNLAGASREVTGIDTCDPFLVLAAERAKKRNVRLALRNISANALVFDRSSYDVITASQVFHWLDPYWATKGLYRVLADAGYFFALESKAVLPLRHPLRQALAFGRYHHREIDFLCKSHIQAYADRFAMLQTDPHTIEFRQCWLFGKRRPFDVTFARAYFFDCHVSHAFPGDPCPWSALGRSLDDYEAGGEESFVYWLVVQFQKCVTSRGGSQLLDISLGQPLDIPYRIDDDV